MLCPTQGLYGVGTRTELGKPPALQEGDGYLLVLTVTPAAVSELLVFDAETMSEQPVAAERHVMCCVMTVTLRSDTI